MGMNKNEKFNNDQLFKRTSDVAISDVDKNDLVKIAIAHFAAGNSDMFKLAFTSLGKISAEQRLENIEHTLANLMKNIGK